ncbi:MAG: rhodanese-like domain-containing protein [Cytophagales bacterium]|nr:rhodanese-like domain-containing protein [Cytophagales bacterium]
MLLRHSLIVLLASAVTVGCSQSPSKTTLAPADFAQKVEQTPGAVVLDVRSAKEYADGHLQKSVNMDWNGYDFMQQVKKLDKSAPVFVYCLSGARSATAASKMRAAGFKEVYELQGGLSQWQAANLPVTIKK